MLGFGQPRLHTLIKAGLPCVTRGKRGGAERYTFNTAEVVEWLLNRVDEKAARRGDKLKTLAAEKTRNYAAHADLKELQLERERAQLVTREDAERVWDRLAQRLRKRFEGIAKHVAKQAANKPAPEVERIAKRAVARTLASISNEE